MTEFGLGMFAQVHLQLLPEPAVVTNLLARGTDGDQPPEHLDFPERALEFVSGYCCANDVTARGEQKALQAKGLPWYGGKNADSFLVLGPAVPAAKVPDPGRLRVMCLVDGAVRQDGSTAEMIRGVAALVAAASRRITLEPGDVILTGTPPGVGPIRPGETVEVRIDGVGSLVNPVVLEERPS